MCGMVRSRGWCYHNVLRNHDLTLTSGGAPVAGSVGHVTSIGMILLSLLKLFTELEFSQVCLQ